MGDENEHLRSQNAPPVYGAVAPEPLPQDELTPLLDAMDSKIQISSEALVPPKEPRRLTQYIAALSVALGGFAMGNALSWTSPTDEVLNSLFGNSTKTSWIASTMPLGAAAVVLPCGWLMDTFGRKLTMLALVPPFVAGWLLILFAARASNSLWMFIVGRLVTGMMGGAFSLTAPAYTSEIADDKVRGMLGTFFQLMVTLGILFVYVLGALEADYNVITGLCTGVPVCFALIFFFMPETPLHLLKKGREEAARHSLQWFRGAGYDIDDEIETHKDSLEKIQRERLTFKQAFSTTPAKKGLFIAVGLMVFQQLCGVNAVIFFASAIFKEAGSHISSNNSAVIIGVMQVVSTFVATQIVDRAGRRILLFISDSVMCICSVLLGVFFYLKDNDPDKAENIGWLPLVSLCVFNIVFSIGFGPIPWMMVGELFPPNIKGLASSVACTCNWILAFCVTKFFSDLSGAIGTGPTFWLFAALSALGTVFVVVFVPETKGKSLQEIQIELGAAQMNDELDQEYSR